MPLRSRSIKSCRKIVKSISANLAKNLAVFIVSVFLAVIIARSGFFERLIAASSEWGIIGSFVSGLFFTSLFTVAPATVALGELAQVYPLLVVSLVGGAGAVIGDFVLFKFLKSHLADDLKTLFAQNKKSRLLIFLHMPVFRWFSWLIGAAIIASPLPDELGLLLIGISSMRARFLIPITFVLNSAGIFIIGLVARGLSF